MTRLKILTLVLATGITACGTDATPGITEAARRSIGGLRDGRRTTDEREVNRS